MKLLTNNFWAGALIALSGIADAQSQPVGQPSLPSATDICPEINAGIIDFLGVSVDIVVAGPKQRQGPLIIYWHGTGTKARDELEYAFNSTARQQLHDAGGMLAALEKSSGIGSSTSGNAVWTAHDMLVADEIVACAVAQINIDPQRIHLLGMSAGGLHSTAMSYKRSHYLASIATLSGGHMLLHGQNGTDTQSSQPDNKFAALIMHGGNKDRYILSFDETSNAFADTLRARGHTAYLCNHGKGHTIPAAVSAAVWRFFKDHPFALKDKYKGVLPSELTNLCIIE